MVARTKPAAPWMSKGRVIGAKPLPPSKWTPGQNSADKVRQSEIAAKKGAIERKLQAENRARQAKAFKGIDSKKGGIATYVSKGITKGKGFTESDYGVGKGAAIPYQLSDATKTVKKVPPGKKGFEAVSDRDKIIKRPTPSK